jgi:hypothetical protein
VADPLLSGLGSRTEEGENRKGEFAMTKRFLWKSALLVLASGTALGLGMGGGCLNEMVRRILIAVAFD